MPLIGRLQNGARANKSDARHDSLEHARSGVGRGIHIKRNDDKHRRPQRHENMRAQTRGHAHSLPLYARHAAHDGCHQQTETDMKNVRKRRRIRQHFPPELFHDLLSQMDRSRGAGEPALSAMLLQSALVVYTEARMPGAASRGLIPAHARSMSNDKLRRQIACEAARLLSAGQESELYRARLKAARRVAGGWVHPNDLPSSREIRDEIHSSARIHEGSLASMDRQIDRFAVYHMLLAPLETVKLDPERHPEGDALYHSLQVFELARDAQPYDEEFQLAALLHDVGKAIDRREHVAAGLDALHGYITERTAWLIEHHSEAGALRDGTLGARARKRLEASDNFEDLMLLCDCDRRGRAKGMAVPDVEEAIDLLRALAESNGD